MREPLCRLLGERVAGSGLLMLREREPAVSCSRRERGLMGRMMSTAEGSPLVRLMRRTAG